MQFVEKAEDLKIPKGGLVIEPQKEEDHIMGGTSTIEKVILRPDGQHDDFLPQVEIQRVGDQGSNTDTFMCVTYSNQNCKEILHKEKYGYEINMDDQFLGVGSGTVPYQGNGVATVAEWSRKNGFIAEKGRILKARTIEEAYTPLTDEERAEGKKNLEFYEFKYAWLPRPLGSASCSPETLVENLKYGPIQASVDGSAYAFNAQGYIGSFVQYTHEIVIFGYKLGEYFKIFDSETEQCLKFAWDYPFGYAMLHSINKLNMKMYKKKGQFAIGFVNEAGTGIRLWEDGEDNLGPVIGGEVFKSLGFSYNLAEPCDDWPLPIVGLLSVKPNKLNLGNMKKTILGAVPALRSSQNPEEISLAVKAGAIALLPALTAVLSIFGIDAGWISDLVNSLVGLVASGCLVWGIIRKFKK